jgi:hypothetical protein
VSDNPASHGESGLPGSAALRDAGVDLVDGLLTMTAPPTDAEFVSGETVEIAFSGVDGYQPARVLLLTRIEVMVDETPPFEFALQLPDNFAGNLPIAAIAEDDDRVFTRFERVEIQVNPRPVGPVSEHRREIVAPEAIPGIADLDFSQVSIPVRIGSVAISRQFPDIGGWPFQVGQERKRRRLAADHNVAPHYDEACIFVSSAGAHAGMHRKLIAGEVIFMRQYRVAMEADDQCWRPAGREESTHCVRYKAVSESSGMCGDTFDAGRAGRFALIAGDDGGEVFYLDGDGIYHRTLHIENGCPRFGNEPQRIADVEADTDELFARRDDQGRIHILWPDDPAEMRHSEIRYVQYDADTRETASPIQTLPGTPSSDDVNLLMTDDGPVATWIDLRFTQSNGWRWWNNQKILLLPLSRNRPTESNELALNAPYDANDDPNYPVSAAANGRPWFGWANDGAGWQDPDRIVHAWLPELDRALITRPQPGTPRGVEDAVVEQLGRYHRQLGRGEDGPLPAVDCTRRWPDEKLRVLVPGEGFVGQEDVQDDDDG